MIKVNKSIEIVRSDKTWLSSLSALSAEAIKIVLSQSYLSVKMTIVNNLNDLNALVDRKPDLVFLGMKFVPSESNYSQHCDKIWLSDYLEANGITHTGSNTTAHETELNKPLAKQAVLDAGFNTSEYIYVKQEEIDGFIDVNLAYPLFVKPSNRGGGLGIDSNSVVQNFSELKSKIQSIADEHGSDSLIESYLPGREFSVAILKDKLTQNLTAMPIELITEADEYGLQILSSEVKSSNSESAVEVVDVKTKSLVCQLAVNVFDAIGARDYGRIDIRLDKDGIPQFLEANLIPSLISGYGSFPKACLINIGLDYEDMINSIVDLALQREFIRINTLDISEDIIGPVLQVQPI